MRLIRVFEGNDGETHFEDIEWEETPTPSGKYVRTDMRKASETMFAIQEPGFFEDWHPAPTKRLFVMVAGTAEVRVTDGEMRTLHQGAVVLFDDVGSRGHTMHVIGDVPRVGMHVSLD